MVPVYEDEDTVITITPGRAPDYAWYAAMKEQYELEKFAREIESAIENSTSEEEIDEEADGTDTEEDVSEKTVKTLPNGRSVVQVSGKDVMSSDYATIMAEAEVKRLEQQLRDTPSTRVDRRRQLEFTRLAIVEFMLLAFGICIPTTHALSTAEEYSNACCTLIWTLACAYVLWKFGTVAEKLGAALAQLIYALTNAVGLLSTGVSNLLITTNKMIPIIVGEVKSYMRVMKVAAAVTAGCHLFESVTTLLGLPFKALRYLFGGDTCGYVHESKEGVQKYNKYGTLISAVLAALIFVAAPMLGFMRAYKMFDPIKRCLENLPYVTWLIDWLSAVCNGTATADDIPASVRAFQSGVEVPVGTGGYMYSTGRESDGKVSCDVGMCKRHEKCDDNLCYCRCHIEDEKKEAEIAVACDDPREGTMGLGTKAQHLLRRNQMTFVKSQEEPIESRRERLEKLADDTIKEQDRRDDLERQHKFALFEKSKKKKEDLEAMAKEKAAENLEINLSIIKQSLGKNLEPPPLVVDEPDEVKEKKQGLEGEYLGECPHCLTELIETEKEKCLCCGGMLAEKHPSPTEIAPFLKVILSPEPKTWFGETLAVIQEGVGIGYGAVQTIANPFLSHVRLHREWYISGTVALIGALAAIAYAISKKNSVEWEDEAGGNNRNRSIRYTPVDRTRTRGHRGKGKHAHLVSGGDEHDLDAASIAEERALQQNEELDRAYEIEIEEEDRRARVKKHGLTGWDDTSEDKSTRKERAYKRRHREEETECCHYKACPKQLPIDACHKCNTFCGGVNCVHWAGCKPTEVLESLPKIAVKQEKLKDKWFPPQRDPSVIVARRRNALRAAKMKEYSHTAQQERQFKALATRLGKRYERPESLLGKEKLLYSIMANRVFKLYQNDVFTSSATCIGDKVFVPLHSHEDTDNVKISNATTTVKLGGEVVPIADDLGIYFHNGTVKPVATKMRPPKNEMVMVIGFHDPDQVEPSCGVGFASSTGLYNAPTMPGDCASPVVACDDGAVVGWHIAGSQDVNRFIPVTEEIIKRARATKPVLNSMLFH